MALHSEEGQFKNPLYACDRLGHTYLILCFAGELALDIGSVGRNMKMIMILIIMVFIIINKKNYSLVVVSLPYCLPA